MAPADSHGLLYLYMVPEIARAGVQVLSCATARAGLREEWLQAPMEARVRATRQSPGRRAHRKQPEAMDGPHKTRRRTDAAACVVALRLLRQTAACRQTGGVQAELRRLIAGGLGSTAAGIDLRTRLGEEAATQVDDRLARIRQRLRQVAEVPLGPQPSGAALADAARKLFNKWATMERNAKDPTTSVAIGTAAATADDVEGQRKQEAGSGRLQVQPREEQASERPFVVVNVLPAKRVDTAAHKLVPGRKKKHSPTEQQRARLLKRVKSWGMHRLLRSTEAGQELFFSIGAAKKRITAWVKASGATSEANPPLAVLRKVATTERLPTAMAAPSGQIWGVRAQGPMDVRMMAHMMGCGWMAEEAERLQWNGKGRARRGWLSEAKLIDAWGATTHYGSICKVWERAAARLGRWLRETAAQGRPRVGAVCAGLGITALQLMRAMGGSATLVFLAEKEEGIREAALRLVQQFGHQPRAFALAESAEMAAVDLRADAEVVTLDCSPFSPAGDGTKVQGALQLLEAVMIGVASRRPKVVIYESTAGLWRYDEWRRAAERSLQSCQAYEWEALRVNPAAHLGLGVSRDRVFYVGILRTLCKA